MACSESSVEYLHELFSTSNILPEDPALVLFENNHGRTSPNHWTTMSDTLIVSPAAGRTVLDVIVCSGIDAPKYAISDCQTLAMKSGTGIRSQSVSNLTDKKLCHSDEEILQLKNKFLLLAELRNRRFFRLLEENQKWTLALVCAVYFFCYSAISMLSPFFLKIAVLHNISTSTYGLIFSIHPAVVFCTSPFIGHITPSLGPKFTFISGVFLCGSCNVLFGTLEYVQDDTQFTVLCFIIRGLGAVGAAAFSTAGATYVANMFPDKVSVIMGTLETCIGLGFSIGPLIGGALFTLGGFQLPFYVMGSVMLLTLPFTFHILPKMGHINNNGHHGTKLLTIFKIPAASIVCLVIVVSSSAWSVLEPTLVIHMEQLAPMRLGLLFLVTSFSYAIFSPFWGWLVGKYDHENLMMIVGLSATAISLLLLGPSPVLPELPKLLWLDILSLFLIGVFVAMAYVPTYQALLGYAIQVGCNTELSTYSAIAGLWASMYSLGEVLGPCVGSIIVDVYDFPMAMTTFGLLNLAVALLLLCNQVCAAIWSKQNVSNMQLLLSNNDTPNISQVGPADPAIAIDEEEKLIFRKDTSQTYGTAC
ncbi:MFS-type transporter SLC18B1-like [Daphnia carinata]|uniref:MFS-type transporter SLC18B1-like n=1 Tax=Daphnia carinata TaxID=120202 RepID=UPI00257FA062|nr:MFS-type transporter SLC18B1-like [Daphnia carinata]